MLQTWDWVLWMWDAFLFCFGNLFWKKSCYPFLSVKCTWWFLVFVLSHIVFRCLTDIFVFPVLQNCTIDRHLQSVSRHMFTLEIECCECVGAFCVCFGHWFWKSSNVLLFDPWNALYDFGSVLSLTGIDISHNFWLMIKKQYTRRYCVYYRGSGTFHVPAPEIPQ